MNIVLPSPIQRINLKLFLGEDCWIDVKRDDLIHPEISGNKWRKLVGYLAPTSLNKTWVSFGGAYSNHLLALASLGKMLNINTIGIVRGDELNANSNTYLQRMANNGMELKFVSRQSYVNKKLLFDTYFNSETHFFIDEGGAGQACLHGFLELAKELDKTYAHIVLPFGTGASAYALAKACQNLQIDSTIHAISVVQDTKAEILKLKALFGSVDQFVLHSSFNGGGYAKSNPILEDFVLRFNQYYDFKIEPIYSGKAMWALTQLIHSGLMATDKPILFIHTGGLAYLNA